MKNNWKYATLSENEKLRRISDGDKDLYRTEKSNTEAYASLLKDSGIDASAADNYLEKLNDAAQNASLSEDVSKDTEQQERPVYLQGKKNDAMLYLLKWLEDVYNDYTNQKENLKALAVKESEGIKESLISRGYSLDGNTGKKQINDTTEKYDNLLKELDEEYLPGIKKVGKALGLISSHIRGNTNSLKAIF